MKLVTLATCVLLFATVCSCRVIFEENFSTTFNPSLSTSPWAWYNEMNYRQFARSVEFRDPVKRKYDVPYPFGISHVSFGSWYVRNMPSISVGENETLTITVESTFRLTGARNHPFGSAVSNPDSDPRLGTCGFLLKDPTTETALCMFSGNRHAWAWHDRFAYPSSSRYNATINEVEKPDYRGFVSWKASERNVNKMFNKHVIEYNRKTKNVKWMLDGEIIRSTNAPGAFPPSDGITVTMFDHKEKAVSSAVDLAKMDFMFACVNEPDKIDYFNPSTTGLYNHNTPDDVYDLPSKWVSNNENSANDLTYQEFGQSVYFKVKSVKIELVTSK